MNAAISGLKMHMDKLNVIGNNIANVNTNGYKAQRMLFKDSLYTTVQGGSNGTSQTGGRNPSQLGYGVQLKSISLDMSAGSYTPTGKATDMMINGDGFFLVGDKTQTVYGDNATPADFSGLNLSRVGDFEIKADGYLTDGQGGVVYGFLATGVDAQTGKPIMSNQLVPIRVPRQAVDANTGDVTIAWPTEAQNGPLTDTVGGGNGASENPLLKYSSLSVSADGKITVYADDVGQMVTVGYIAVGSVANPNGVTHTSGNYYTAGEGSGDLSISMFGGVAADLGLTYVALGNGAQNADQGMRIGNCNSDLLTNGLEGSKTDLANEISDMITAQRGYQANTRIITVTDSMLEELVNIKR